MSSQTTPSCVFAEQILRNQMHFRRMEQKIARQATLKKRCHAALDAAEYAVHHATDVFASAEVEAPFLELARSVSFDLEETYEEGSFLHVMTEAYVSGGHTRCVERWIEHSPAGQTHSCIILNQRAPLPASLERICREHGGSVVLCDKNKSMLEVALELRLLASRFSCIVLHTHMDDPRALIAFGTPEFRRPIVLFNHADHIFWLGSSIADQVADINSSGSIITAEHRNILETFVLGIPSDGQKKELSGKDDARKKLGISSDRKIIFASGSSTKFLRSETIGFADIISSILTQEPDAQFCIIGASGKDEEWQRCKQHASRIILMETMPYDQYCQWLSSADLVLDSYPVGGGTALIDAVTSGKPVLCFNPVQQSDFIYNTEAYSSTVDELLEKAHHILHDSEYALEHAQKTYRSFELCHSADAWKRSLKGLLQGLPSFHKVWNRRQEKSSFSEVSMVTSRFCRWIEPRLARQNPLKTLWHRLFSVKWKSTHKELKIFGWHLFYDRNIF